MPFPACNCDLGEGCSVKKDGSGAAELAVEPVEEQTEEVGEDEDALIAELITGGKGTCVETCKRGAKSTCKRCDGPNACGECCEKDCKMQSKTVGPTTYKFCTCGKGPKPKGGGATRAYEQQAHPPPRCPTGTQFPVPHDDLYGYGDVPPVLISDKLHVPAATPKGDYVLSWRWDCEQTPQIWNTCADLTVV